jgi:hypothetical protein
MSIRALIAAAAALLMVGVAGAAGLAAGAETAPFNLDVILRDVAGGPGFGQVEFRQPNSGQRPIRGRGRSDDKIIYLNTLVGGLEPAHAYLLQRAVDTNLDGQCTSTAWLTLGKGLTSQTITTDERGTAREFLFRDVSAIPTGMQFDIHFQLIDAGTGTSVLASGCYSFTVSQ